MHLLTLPVRFESKTSIVAALLLSWSAAVGAAPLFEDDSVLAVTLRGPLGSVFADVEERGERPFVIEIDGTGYPVAVRLRGKSRLRVCEFPPLRLNFRKEDTAQTVFEDQDKLKLVTHCRNYDRAEQDLLEEYAAYRIFNVLTDQSYRVRLMRITYIDSDGKLEEKGRHRFGFVRETSEQLAARMGAQTADLRGLPKKRHDLEQAALVYVYQYLIANTDWGLVTAEDEDTCCHNIDLFERDNTVVFVPYDLDLSGLVNTKYAFPDRRLRIRKVTRRLYRGLCTEPDTLRAALDTVVAREAEIMEVLGDTPGLSEENRDKAIRYIARFFEEARDENKLLGRFEERCLD